MMLTLVTGLIGLTLLMGFVGFMLVWVPAPPLIIIIVSVLALVVYDFVQTVRFGDNHGQRR